MIDAVRDEEPVTWARFEAMVRPLMDKRPAPLYLVKTNGRWHITSDERFEQSAT